MPVTSLIKKSSSGRLINFNLTFILFIRLWKVLITVALFGRKRSTHELLHTLTLVISDHCHDISVAINSLPMTTSVMIESSLPCAGWPGIFGKSWIFQKVVFLPWLCPMSNDYVRFWIKTGSVVFLMQHTRVAECAWNGGYTYIPSGNILFGGCLLGAVYVPCNGQSWYNRYGLLDLKQSIYQNKTL